MADRYRWWILGLSTTSLGLMYGTALSFPVIMLMLMKDLNLSYAAAASFMSVFQGGQWVGFYPGGWLADRFGEKPVLSYGTGVAGICLILWGLSAGYPAIMYLFFGLAGLAGAFSWSAAFSLVTKWFPREEHGKAVGMVNAGWMGIFLIIYSIVAPALAGHFGWPGPTRILSAFILVWVAILLVMIRMPQKPADEQGPAWKEKQTEESVVRNIGLWVMGIVGGSYICQFQVFMTFMPSYFQEVCGLSLKQAGLGAMVYIGGNIVGGIAGGFTAGRIGILKTQIIGCLISASAIIMAILVIKDWRLLSILLFICGFGPVFAMGPYLGLAPMLVSAEKVASAMGLLSVLQWTPGLFMPVLSGWTLGLTGSYRPMFILATVFPLLGALICPFGKRYLRVNG